MSMVTVTLANQGNASFEVSTHKPLLSSLRAAGVELPYGCEYGGCITCAHKLLSITGKLRTVMLFYALLVL
jgi:ferredoxin